jgi:hypothetical protein
VFIHRGYDTENETKQALNTVPVLKVLKEQQLSKKHESEGVIPFHAVTSKDTYITQGLLKKSSCVENRTI